VRPDSNRDGQSGVSGNSIAGAASTAEATAKSMHGRNQVIRPPRAGILPRPRISRGEVARNSAAIVRKGAEKATDRKSADYVADEGGFELSI
jgi:hypothetical protein